MYSADAKDEIARARFDRACCPGTFVRALAAFSRRLRSADLYGRPADDKHRHDKYPRYQNLIVRTERGAIARAALKAAKLSGIDAHATQMTGKRFHDGHVVVVAATGNTALPARLDPPGRSCCRRAWLRAAFLACGSVTYPARGYHLELFCRDDAAARALAKGFAEL